MSKSKELFEQSQKYIPGGVNSPVRAFRSVNRAPLFIKKAKGSRIFDEDGREYIDYVCSWGPGILGHAHEQVIEAVREACADGLTFGTPTKKELTIAKLITAHMPSMEMSRMVNSGTEAVMSAVRAARGFTGRDYIMKFKGCYHGHSDGLLVKAGSAVITQTVASSAGVPDGYVKYTLVADYNDEESVKKLFDEYRGQIAAVLVEPVAANMGVVPPKEGFLEFLRDITQTDGALLIFDEVITGFRLSPGGAQQYYGIRPDLTTLGKIVGGGMPVGAYGGRREIMQCVAPLGEVYQAGTLSGNPIAMTAGIETIRLLDQNPQIYQELEAKTRTLAETAKRVFGDSVCINRVGSLMSIFFTNRQVTDMDSAMTADTAHYADFFGYMLDRGINLAPSQFEAMFVSAAHTDEDIRETCAAAADYAAACAGRTPV